MRRRALVRSTAALGLAGSTALAGCAALYGEIRADAAESHLHAADEPYLRPEFAIPDGDTYRAWYLPETPETDPFVDRDLDPVRSLRESLLADDDGDAFVVLFEARMPTAERFHLAPSHFHEPGWVRLADAEIPLDRHSASDDDPGFDAEFAVATGLARYEARTPPDGVTLHVYPADDRGDADPVARFDARDGL